MGRKYVRTSDRKQWTEAQLEAALDCLKEGKDSYRGLEKKYGISARTLKRRKQKMDNGEDFTLDRLGPDSAMGKVNEQKLATHIRALQQRGWAATGKHVRRMAYHLAQQMNVADRFSAEKAIAGNHWLKSFMERNGLSLRKPQGVSANRALGLDKKEVDDYFALLRRMLNEFNLHHKPSHIFNMDETGLQLNSKPNSELVVAETNTVVQKIQSSERGELVTVIGCANAEGSFFPPFCIFKGKNIKETYKHGMPSGSQIRMSQKSAYVNIPLFLDWLKNHFLPRKPPGKVLLVLDGHSTHLFPDTLQFAVDNDVEIVCLPSHCTHYLQPMDRAFFKPLKAYFNQEANIEVETNRFHRLNRENFGTVLNRAWNKAAIPATAKSGFEATGIHPYAPDKIPAYAFLGAESASLGAPQNTAGVRRRRAAVQRAQSSSTCANSTSIRSGDNVFTLQLSNPTSVIESSDTTFTIQVTKSSSTASGSTHVINILPQATSAVSCPSGDVVIPTESNENPPVSNGNPPPSNENPPVLNGNTNGDVGDEFSLYTPRQTHNAATSGDLELSKKTTTRKKQNAVQATAADFIEGKRKRQVAKPDPKKKTKCDEKNADVEKKKPIKKPRKPKTEAPAKKNVKKSLFPKRKRTKATESSSESDVDGDLKYVSESDSEFSDDSEKCLYCDGLWSNDKNGESWIKCQKCSMWVHSDCAGIMETADMYTCEFCIKRIAAQRR